jgi:hypothetical protein
MAGHAALPKNVSEVEEEDDDEDNGDTALNCRIRIGTKASPMSLSLKTALQTVSISSQG